MSYELVLSIPEGSPEEQNIDNVAEVEHISREEAARKLLAAGNVVGASTARERQVAAVESLTGRFRNQPWILQQLREDRRQETELDENGDRI